ncbi:MAG TPA: lipoate--protein ligase [Gemmatimonadales bacterium]|nr:lipoate--protein ligase [Gemmatimonadales bacterium]
MLYVDNLGHTDPRLNLALEEYVLRHRFPGEECLLFYINEPSIIIGRNQNTVEEIDPDAVEARGIHVVRRISGGGAVYHDLGNLNFSFIAPYAPGRFNRYEAFTRPVIAVLRELGVPAELGGRNDILADGRKISGNAQFVSGDRMFSHGTVLVHTDLEVMPTVLTPRPGKIESKGHKSVRSRVANIREFLAEPLTAAELRSRLLEGIFGDASPEGRLRLDDADWAAVRELAESKYGTWEWNIGRSPPSNISRARRFPAGEIDVRIDVQDGRIAGVRFFGDFIGLEEVSALERRLTGVRFDRHAVGAALDAVEVSAYFGPVGREELLALLFG